jgi:glycerate kinase
MRVLIAPAAFRGTLTAAQAADAIAEGWRRRAPGDDLMLAPLADDAALLRLVQLARAADLILTGEGSFDYKSRTAKGPRAAAEAAATAIRPCVVLAGRVMLGAREMRVMGVESAYAVVDVVGEERALAEPAESLAALAERVARTWSLPR